jgi:hypothetical protein
MKNIKNFTEFINEDVSSFSPEEKIKQFLNKWWSEYIIYEYLSHDTGNKEYDKDVHDLLPIEIEVVDYDTMYQINFWLNTKVPYDLEITNNEENINHYLKKYNVQIPHYTEY